MCDHPNCIHSNLIRSYDTSDVPTGHSYDEGENSDIPTGHSYDEGENSDIPTGHSYEEGENLSMKPDATTERDKSQCLSKDNKMKMMGDIQDTVNERNNRKWDKGKLKYSLILTDFLELMADILTKGEENHPRESSGQPSWQLVEPEAYLDALIRHVQEYRKEASSLDKDMGTHHMGHVAVNAMFLYWLSLKDTNDKEWEAVLSDVSDVMVAQAAAGSFFTEKTNDQPIPNKYHDDLLEAVTGFFDEMYGRKTSKPVKRDPLALDECIDIIHQELEENEVPVGDSLKNALQTLEDRSWK